MEQALFIFGTNCMLVIMSLCGLGFAMGYMRGAKTPKARLLNQSRVWMTLACLMLCIESMIHKFVLGPSAQMLDFQMLTLFFSYLLSRFLAFGMSPSFDRSYLSTWRISFILARVTIVGIMLLVARFAPVSAAWKLALFIVCLVWFVADTTCLIIHVAHSYLVTRKAYEEFYSEDYDRYLLWTPLMMLLLHLYAIGWTPILFAPLGVQGVYGFFGAALWFYLFVCYERHTIYFRYRKNSDLEALIPEPVEPEPEAEAPRFEVKPDMPVAEMEERYGDFVTALSEWVERKGYTKPDITIEVLARSCGTNRTYLSSFINAHYGLPFRTWIASLRIAEAKHLLLSGDMREQDIAARVGFSSMQAFCRTFSQIEGCSPSAFRGKEKKA